MSTESSFPSFRQAAAILATSPKSAKDRRRFCRHAIELTGRLMDSAGREFDCRTIDISPGDLLIASDAVVDVGHTIVLYCEHIGRISGQVTRVVRPGLFALVSDATAHKREKTAETLTRLINPGRAEDTHQRRETRHNGGGSAIVVLDNGKQIPVEILDFSVVGCALKSPSRPPIGAWVQIGSLHGRVARYFEAGFAVDFQTKPSSG